MTNKKIVAKNISKSPIFENIIVGVDFSTYSKIVVKQAEKIAEELHANLILVYAVIEPWQLTNPEVYSVVSMPPLEVKTADVEKEVRKFYKPKGDVKVIALEGPPYKVLQLVSEQHPASLIVIGSRGRGAFSRFMLGSNAEQIALTSKFPVWVHRGQKIVSFDRILVPMDLSENAQKVVALFKDWSQKKKLKHSFIFIRPDVPPTLNYPAYRKSFDKIYHAVLKSLNDFKRSHADAPLITAAGDPAERICHFGQRHNVIAMNPHNRSEIFGTFGKVTTKVIRLSKNPILVLKTEGV